MAIRVGSAQIPELFRYTFVCVLLTIPVFGWLTRSFRRQVFMPAIFIFCICNLLTFAWALEHPEFDQDLVARAFFVWLSVFNMFIVAVFWSFMNDLYQREQAKRLFGIIAAGGSLGAICGPLLTTLLVRDLGVSGLIPVSAGLLSLALLAIIQLFRWAAKQTDREIAISKTQPIGGDIFAGIKLVFSRRYLTFIMLMTLVGTGIGTALYLFQADLLGRNYPDSAARTQVLAGMDAAINVITLVLQFGVARFAIASLGVRRVLLIMPLVTIIGLSVLVVFPEAIALILVQVFRRGSGFGLNNPARETLYSVVSADAKYKAKNFVDVSVVRGADVISSTAFVAIGSYAASHLPLLLVALSLCLVWIWLTQVIGKQFEYSERNPQTEAHIA